MLASRVLSAVTFAAFLLTSTSGQADVPIRKAHSAIDQLPDHGSRFLRATTGSSRTPLLVRVQDRSTALAQGLIPITETLAVGHSAPPAWPSLLTRRGINRAVLAPARGLLLDRAGTSVRREEAQNDTSLTGENVIVGVVDTGADAAHPALQRADGTSRIAWMLVFGEDPRGEHAAMEEEYGCNGEDPCAVYSADDLNAIIDSRILAGLPDDPIGHGTHITSLAAGRDSDYPGMAPESDLVIVAASEVDGGVSDARILLGTKFVFDRASERNQPAVVNISLGSSLGAHDGSSEVEQGLAELGSGPGRSIVIAAGNSGGVHSGLFPEYPEPFGIHTEVAVLPSSEIRVPVITPPHPRKNEVTGSFFVWIATQPGDDISLGFDNGSGVETNLIGLGQASGITSSELGDDDRYDVVILNGLDDGQGTAIPPGSLFVAVVGTWKSGRVFELILRGSGNARLWINGREDLSPAVTGIGPVFPRARTSGTVAVPGSHPDLITVGATVNRLSWIDFAGGLVTYAEETGVRSDFSASGPNQGGTMKPEIVAPGGGVIGAMARDADPRTSLSPFSQFSAFGSCSGGVECFVIDDEHGVASGTSMSAPMVSGAIALMMQRDPTLTMEKAKRHLMAGASKVPEQDLGSRTGVGQLDLVGALLAQERSLSDDSSSASPSHCRVAWANDFVYPGASLALEGYLLLRDQDNTPIRVPSSEIEVEVMGPGSVTKEELDAGLVHFRVVADAGSASKELVVTTRVDGHLVSQDRFIIERDPTLAEHGFELAGGSCAYGRQSNNTNLLALLFLMGGLRLLRRRERH